jgi:hypothetical protein
MPDTLATLTDRLYTEHQPGLTHADIDAVVQRCRADLADAPAAALPELLERLARQRLTTYRPAAPTGAAGSADGCLD